MTVGGRVVRSTSSRAGGAGTNLVSTSPTSRPFSIAHTIPDLGGAQPMYTVLDSIDYQATDIANGTPPALGGVGLRITANYGSQSGAIAATGGYHGLESQVLVRNAAQANAEHAALYAILRYDQSAGVGGSAGRGWLADFTVHGAIALQQQLLTGVNVVLANYYNGQPSENPSCAYSASAGTGIGGSLDAAHAAATRYPGGDGYWVGGLTSASARGFDYGFRVGGAGGPWGVTTSKVGYAFGARDYDTAGLRLHARSGTAAGIIIESDGGSLVVGRASALSTVATLAGTFVAPAADPASQMVSFLTNDAQLADRGASIGLGGATNDAASTFRNFALIAGRKLNGTTTDTSGYLQFQVNKSGTGLQQVLRMSIDGAWTLLDGTTIDVGSTTGTKFGTATTQKMGWWNATPVVKGSVTGSRGANAALASLLTLLASYGLLTDSSSA